MIIDRTIYSLIIKNIIILSVDLNFYKDILPFFLNILHFECFILTHPNGWVWKYHIIIIICPNYGKNLYI